MNWRKRMGRPDEVRPFLYAIKPSQAMSQRSVGMSKQVFNLIHEGLKEALAVAESETAASAPTKIVGNSAIKAVFPVNTGRKQSAYQRDTDFKMEKAEASATLRPISPYDARTSVEPRSGEALPRRRDTCRKGVRAPWQPSA